MKPYLLINPEHPGYYYALFYLLAFLTGFVLLMIEGRRRNFQLIPWMLVIATAFLFFMIGCRVITFSALEWGYVIRFEPIPYSTGRSVLGGILLSIPGILLAREFLRVKVGMMDAFALVLPIALVVERFGCLMAGCCYGTPTHLPWAIQYGKTSHAFVQQVHDGLLSAGSSLSLPVHPVQIYEVVSCIAIVFILGRFRRPIKAPGNFFLTSVALYGAARFLLEFFRSAGEHTMGIPNKLGMNYIQWISLLVVLGLACLIAWRKRNVRPVPDHVVEMEFFRPTFYFLLVALLFLFLSRWISPLDIISFHIVLIPILVVLTWHLFNWVTIPRYRVATLILPLAALLLMNQTVPATTQDESTKLSYTTLSVGYTRGSIEPVFGTEGCNGNATYYNNKYSAAALGIRRTVQNGRKNISFGVNAFTGSHTESVSGLSAYSYNAYSTAGINPYVQFDFKNVGIGTGFTAGDLTRIAVVEKGDLTSVKRLGFSPSFNLRVGELSKFFVEYKYANQFPTAFPSLMHQFSLGFGFKRRAGIWKGGTIRIGTASNCGLLVSTSCPIGGKVIFDVYTGIGEGLGNSYDHAHNMIAAINFHFKFNDKKKP